MKHHAHHLLPETEKSIKKMFPLQEPKLIIL